VSRFAASQVAGITDEDARHILTDRDLAGRGYHVFRFAAELRPLRQLTTRDLAPATAADPNRLAAALSRLRGPDVLVLGIWGRDIPICLDPRDGQVVGWTPWGPAETYPVNSSLRAFVASIEAIEADPRYRSARDDPQHYRDVEARLRKLLTAIDPVAMAEEDGFWDSTCWDVGNGDWA
jgi:hypothetical protein